MARRRDSKHCFVIMTLVGHYAKHRSGGTVDSSAHLFYAMSSWAHVSAWLLDYALGNAHLLAIGLDNFAPPLEGRAHMTELHLTQSSILSRHSPVLFVTDFSASFARRLTRLPLFQGWLSHQLGNLWLHRLREGITRTTSCPVFFNQRMTPVAMHVRARNQDLFWCLPKVSRGRFWSANTTFRRCQTWAKTKNNNIFTPEGCLKI